MKQKSYLLNTSSVSIVGHNAIRCRLDILSKRILNNKNRVEYKFDDWTSLSTCAMHSI